MNIQLHYVTYADFGPRGIGHKCDPSSFDDAVDAYAEAIADGQDAAVFRMEPPTDTKAGMMIDVTVDARERLVQRFNDRRMDIPEWFEEAI